MSDQDIIDTIAEAIGWSNEPARGLAALRERYAIVDKDDVISARDIRQAVRQLHLFLNDGNRDRVNVALVLLEPKKMVLMDQEPVTCSECAHWKALWRQNIANAADAMRERDAALARLADTRWADQTSTTTPPGAPETAPPKPN